MDAKIKPYYVTQEQVRSWSKPAFGLDCRHFACPTCGEVYASREKALECCEPDDERDQT